jgi:hypothetical protein
MSGTTKTTYESTWTCDRCKETVVAEVVAEVPPEGWEYLINDENEKFDLCPECCESFAVWMMTGHVPQVAWSKVAEQAVDCTCPRVRPFDPSTQTTGCMGWTYKPCKLHPIRVTY